MYYNNIMFKNKKIIYVSLLFALFSLISMAIMLSVSPKVGGMMLLTSLVLQLFSGLVYYYGFTENSLFGRSKKRTPEESLTNQSNGFKEIVPLLFAVVLTIVLITIYFIWYS